MHPLIMSSGSRTSAAFDASEGWVRAFQIACVGGPRDDMALKIPAVMAGKHGSLLARSAQRSTDMAQPGFGRCCGAAGDAGHCSCRRELSRARAPGRFERAAE